MSDDRESKELNNFNAVSLAFEYGKKSEFEDVGHAERSSSSVEPLGIPFGVVDYKATRYRTLHPELFMLLDEKKERGPVPLIGPKVVGTGSQGRLIGALIPDKLQDEGWRPNPIMQVRGGIRERLQHPLQGLGGVQVGPDIVGALLYRRCPAGYEHGGRFTNRAFGNCGARLFDIFDGPGGRSIFGIPTDLSTGRGTRRNIGRAIGEGRYLNAPTEMRRPQLPPLGPSSLEQRDRVVKDVVSRFGNGAGGETSVFVRADGVASLPKAPFPKIARRRNNPEIADGVVVMRARTANDFGGDEVSMLGAGAQSIVYALPGNKGTVSIARSSDNLTGVQAGSIRRRMGTLQRNPDVTPIEAVRAVADGSPGLTYSESFTGIEKPTELVTVTRDGTSTASRQVPRWVYETFLASNAPGRGTNSAWSISNTES
jgi:hypothetical protein